MSPDPVEPGIYQVNYVIISVTLNLSTKIALLNLSWSILFALWWVIGLVLHSDIISVKKEIFMKFTFYSWPSIDGQKIPGQTGVEGHKTLLICLGE